MEATTPYETWNSLMTDEILNKIVQPQKWCQTERQKLR